MADARAAEGCPSPITDPDEDSLAISSGVVSQLKTDKLDLMIGPSAGRTVVAVISVVATGGLNGPQFLAFARRLLSLPWW
jgi:hypothetical protein